MLAGLGFLIAPATTAAPAPAQGTTSVQLPYPNNVNTGNPQGNGGSVTCPSATWCASVGAYEDSSGFFNGLIETGYGSTWTATRAPEPPNAGTDGDGEQDMFFGGFNYTGNPVSCASTTFCVAVGSYEDTGGFNFGLIETWNGNSWTATQAPVPVGAGTDGDGNQNVDLESVSCPLSGSCVAVGSYKDASGTFWSLIETLSGGVWTPTAAGTSVGGQATEGSFLDWVTCVSTISCQAVGGYQDGSGFEVGLIETLAGTTWSATSAPEPSNSGTDGDSHQNATLASVSCSSSSSCAAVGRYVDTTGAEVPLIDNLSGGAWSVSPGSEPPNAGNDGDGHQGGRLVAVSCPAPTNCVAVGEYLDTSGNDFPLIEAWNGSAWSPTQAPQPSNAGTISGFHSYPLLEDVACPAANSCLAVGQYRDTAGVFPGLLEKWNGATWIATAAPVPSTSKGPDNVGGQNGWLIGVGCNSPVSCATTGQFEDTQGLNQALAITWTGAQGYWLDASDGGIFTYPNNTFFGSTGGVKLNKPMVGMAATPDGQGYWLVASDGGIFSYGDAVFQGSRGGKPLNAPIVGMATTPDGAGYWLVASDGGIFNYGDAGFFGSRGGQPLNKPIVGMGATADGKGYRLVASDGGIFSYGDATFYGSTGSLKLNKPVVGMAATPTGLGYWLVASDGGIFNYGDAAFYGSTGSIVLNKPVVGMAASPSGKGYWLAASDGGIFNYGDAPFQGSAGALHLNAPVVGMAGG
jgi:hypothetical protein